MMTTMTLRQQIEYIEGHEKGTIIDACKMYRRRHIFEDMNGKLYVLTKIAGWDTFDDTMDAIHAINENPDHYIIASKGLRALEPSDM